MGEQIELEIAGKTVANNRDSILEWVRMVLIGDITRHDFCMLLDERHQREILLRELMSAQPQEQDAHAVAMGVGA